MCISLDIAPTYCIRIRVFFVYSAFFTSFFYAYYPTLVKKPTLFDKNVPWDQRPQLGEGVSVFC